MTRTFKGSPLTDNHIYGKAASENIYDGAASTLMAQTAWNYDTLSLVSRSGTIPNWSDPGSTPRGLLTETSSWLNTNSSWLTTTQQYDVLGNPVTSTDPAGHVTQSA